MRSCFELDKQAQTHTYLNPYRYSSLGQALALSFVSLTAVVGTVTWPKHRKHRCGCACCAALYQQALHIDLSLFGSPSVWHMAARI